MTLSFFGDTAHWLMEAALCHLLNQGCVHLLFKTLFVFSNMELFAYYISRFFPTVSFQLWLGNFDCTDLDSIYFTVTG